MKFIIIQSPPDPYTRIIPIAEVKEIQVEVVEKDEYKDVIINIFLKSNEVLSTTFCGELDDFWEIFEKDENLDLEFFSR